MVFSSLVFLFAYLPVTLLIYYIVPRKGRNLFLFFINLVFYGWGEPMLVFLMLFNVLFNYVGGWLVDKYRSDAKKKKLFLVLTCVLDIGILAVFKYTGMITDTLNMLPFLNIPSLHISLPIGISFYTFQTMSYVIDVYRDDAPVSKSFINFGTYLALFPQLIAGPIVRYRDVADQMIHRRETLAQFTKGVKIFCIGLGKKVLIANQMGVITNALFETTHIEPHGILGTWFGIAAYTFQIYFDFSGYSDMACGLGNMLGFEFLKNFNYPYISKSITEFWRRWHISLSTWFKEYVYIPLGGNRKGVKRQIINLLIVWGLTGLWHGAAYNFIFWGLFYGLLLILEKFVLKKYLDRLPSVLQHIYTLFIVLIGWTLFYFTDVNQLFATLGDMFNFSKGIISSNTLNLFLSNLPLMIVAAIAGTPLGARLYERFKHIRFMWVLETVFVAGVLFLSTASLVDQSYNPFLYFRF
ncbi:MAG TPA: transcriptional regulator [Ruminococcaceae bacterium]|nr:transcriptional regulator [Oscillospiraceae bacterium]